MIKVSFKDILDYTIYKVYICMCIREREREYCIIEKRKKKG
jgi:hypothetical protein